MILGAEADAFGLGGAGGDGDVEGGAVVGRHREIMVVVKCQSIGFSRLRDVGDLVHWKLYFREAEAAILRHEDAGSVAGCALQPDEAEAFIEKLDSLRDARTAIKGIFVDAGPLVSGIRRLLETVEAGTRGGIRDDEPVACIGIRL